MRPHQAQKLVRELARESGNVWWSAHARERMVQREISDRMALAVLRNGYVKGDVVPGDQTGEWKVKIADRVKGSREVGVVTIIISEGRLLVKTVEWEDR